MKFAISIVSRFCRAAIPAAISGAILAAVTFGIAAVLPGPAVAQSELKTGVAAYRAGDFKTALREFSKLAETGHANAQFNLAILYLTGNGVERDVARSVELHRKAADQNLPAAQHGLGVFYYQGLGVTQDYAEALKWFKRAASQGFADSEFNLGVMYFNNKSVKRDDFEIVKWITLAAARKFAPAEYRLGQMYEKGVIFRKNEREALHWYRLAEAHGDKNAPADRARVAKALNITGPLAAVPTPRTKPKTKPETKRETKRAKIPEKPVKSGKSGVKFSVTMPGQNVENKPVAESRPPSAQVAAAPPKPAEIRAKNRAEIRAENRPPRRESRVQFASFRSEAEATEAWKRLANGAGDAIGDIPPIITRANLGARGIYHRLQAGPLKDRPAAAALCTRIRAALPRQDCLALHVRSP